ncbi:TPA: fructosamine kinase family protein, partial [Staphylococcus aureus]
KKNIPVPKVINTGRLDNNSFLLLEFIDNNPSNHNGYGQLGEIIGSMHQNHHFLNLFGFSHDFKGGVIEFSNNWTSSWKHLFVKNRLDKLCSEIYKYRLFSYSDVLLYEDVRRVILKTLSYHKSQPSLLHGDLWKGNLLFSNNKPILCDPVCLYGDREFDLGYTLALGKFPIEFYQEYNKVYPLSIGYEKRIEFYKLYVFMVHLFAVGFEFYNKVKYTMYNILNKHGADFLQE